MFASAKVVNPIVRATAVSCASSAHQITPSAVPPSTSPSDGQPQEQRRAGGSARRPGAGLRSIRSGAGAP